MMRVIFYILLLAFVLKAPLMANAQRLIAQSPLPPPPDFDDEEDEEDEEDMDEPPAMRPPPMPSPFNQANPNAGGPPPPMPSGPGNTRPPPDFSNTGFRQGSTMGSAVGTVMANPSKVKFKIVDGEFYQKGKKRGRDKITYPSRSE